MKTFLQDFRYAVRILRKSPGFAAVAIGTLAVGIGANTAIFSLVRAVLLDPLPFGDPERVVMVMEAWRPACSRTFSATTRASTAWPLPATRT
jgi:putative ABC transport system permease protein